MDSAPTRIIFLDLPPVTKGRSVLRLTSPSLDFIPSYLDYTRIHGDFSCEIFEHFIHHELQSISNMNIYKYEIWQQMRSLGKWILQNNHYGDRVAERWLASAAADPDSRAN